MKAAFVTLGCKLNYAETSTYERGFRAAGWEIVPWRERADLYLVNTCCVTETAGAKSRSEIRKLHRINPQAPIVVTGCYAQMSRERVQALEGVALVFGSDEKGRVVSDSLALFSSGPEAFPGDVPVFPAYSSGERTRSFLKVQDGCDNFCAYCTVPFARGRSRNIPICEALRQAREIAALGMREIVLTGVNTGDFGRSTGESFLDLLKALNGVEGIERYRISSIEPNLLTEETVDWIASGTKFQKHFHIPLQTGCDELLERMGRRYTTAEFEAKLSYIRARMERPGEAKVFFGIDVMAGLPGETDELFARTLAFLRRIRPAFIHAFPYSVRPGTRAAEMDGQVDERVKKERVAALEALCAELHDAFTEENRGLPERVLFESRERDGRMSGYTGNYIRISRPYDPTLVGKLTEVTI
ncbi:MAG: tRNA (N(6)-L-threonylcarbamoyladenosine(37)-C(2))-methylthiotransferase MtaB [Bacteroidales bacterium]|nr:tRNA (N(6)-L-threonylcarbamoyladenosine(37)-C(2))-methylthiotransferase MtaB [Bacteroidales bacterium]